MQRYWKSSDDTTTISGHSDIDFVILQHLLAKDVITMSRVNQFFLKMLTNPNQLLSFWESSVKKAHVDHMMNCLGGQKEKINALILEDNIEENKLDTVETLEFPYSAETESPVKISCLKLSLNVKTNWVFVNLLDNKSLVWINVKNPILLRNITNYMLNLENGSRKNWIVFITTPINIENEEFWREVGLYLKFSNHIVVNQSQYEYCQNNLTSIFSYYLQNIRPNNKFLFAMIVKIDKLILTMTGELKQQSTLSTFNSSCTFFDNFNPQLAILNEGIEFLRDLKKVLQKTILFDCNCNQNSSSTSLLENFYFRKKEFNFDSRITEILNELQQTFQFVCSYEKKAECRVM